jgi:hypothetical protein
MRAFFAALHREDTLLRRSEIAALAVALAFAAVVPAAHAVDGVVEINQAKAEAGSVTSGDAPGFPVTIAAPGSYRLTGNLSVLGAALASDVSGIEITADDVALDLGGFTIGCRRPTIPFSPCASTTGAGRGIVATGSNVRVANGTIRDFADDGMIAGADAIYVVESVVFRSNGGDGFRAGIRTNGQILRSLFADNEGTGMGFSANASAVVLKTSTFGNASGVAFGEETDVFGGELLLRDEPALNLSLGQIGCIVYGDVRHCP